MKKIILIAVVMMSLTVNSQIQISESQTERLTVSLTRSQTLVRFTNETETTFAFYYKNYKYKTLTDIQYFKIEDEAELLSLLDLIEDVLVNKKEYNIKLTNGTQIILKKTMGTCYIFTSKGYTYFDKKNLSKIRGFINDFNVRVSVDALD